MQNGQSSSNNRVLHSWKEIASYTGRGVRTIQRYEAQYGFPVRRPSGSPRSAVLAFAHEIDEWLGKSPTKSESVPKEHTAAQNANLEEIHSVHQRALLGL